MEPALCGTVPSVEDGFVQKVGGFHFCAEKQPAVERKTGLLETDGTRIQYERREPGFGRLVGVAAGA